MSTRVMPWNCELGFYAHEARQGHAKKNLQYFLTVLSNCVPGITPGAKRIAGSASILAEEER
jgi:hypothetical protein